MKLLEEIKQAEEEGERLKQEAELKGKKDIDDMLEKMNSGLDGLDAEKEKIFEHARQKAEENAAKQIESLSKDHKKRIAKLEKDFEKNKAKAMKKMQEIILKWPSSR